ncbi:TIGR02611 family protein [Rathayibacter sp. YIM 133350]|uniref:TIGR02611 family protein n=1 Tax=Rathayibacter sp. YIM 133350 TaxID=3131992 RepID=UPI00307F5D6C
MASEQEIEREIAAGENPQRPVRRMLRRAHRWIHSHPRLRTAYRAGVAVVGVVVALAGLVLVPLPGPGWLIVFIGLAILGTEFAWARRQSAFIKRQLSRFWAWWNARRARRADAAAGSNADAA